MGYTLASVRLGAFREETLKPILYALLALLTSLLVILGLRHVPLRHRIVAPQTATILSWLMLAGAVVCGLLVVRTPDLAEYMTVRRFTLDAAHFWIGIGVLLVGLVLALQGPDKSAAGVTPASLAKLLWALLIFTSACGVLILLKLGWLGTLTRLAYTGLDLGLTLLALICVVTLLLRLGRTDAPQAN
ncbi:MAG: hypothetical protein QHJ82_17070 [Verrucomicrobiota bacterium]|nr:hypothetical protein [Verrucomicrobiota bacterium]